MSGWRLGVYGFSLGAFHGLELAATDGRVVATAALAGGLPRNVAGSRVAQAAPVLLLHGTEDRTVPIRRSEAAAAVWRGHDRPARLVPLKGTGHVPRGEARDEVVRETADFLAEALGR